MAGILVLWFTLMIPAREAKADCPGCGLTAIVGIPLAVAGVNVLTSGIFYGTGKLGDRDPSYGKIYTYGLVGGIIIPAVIFGLTWRYESLLLIPPGLMGGNIYGMMSPVPEPDPEVKRNGPAGPEIRLSLVRLHL